MIPQLAIAAAKAPPIIDLDSTVFVQLAIFLIAAVALSRFVFKPYLAIRAQRAAGIEGAREEAVRLKEEAESRLSDYETTFSTARAKANIERGKLQSEGVAREREILAAAREATQASLESSRTKLAADAAETRKQLEPRAQEIARSIARKILGREVA